MIGGASTAAEHCATNSMGSMHDARACACDSGYRGDPQHVGGGGGGGRPRSRSGGMYINYLHFVGRGQIRKGTSFKDIRTIFGFLTAFACTSLTKLVSFWPNPPQCGRGRSLSMVEWSQTMLMEKIHPTYRDRLKPKHKVA